MTEPEFQQQVLKRFEQIDSKIDELRDEMNGNFGNLLATMVKGGLIMRDDVVKASKSREAGDYILHEMND